jgi:endonuclease/exonuclease/phosphatase (EEP) superfamily protein YafD
MRIRVIVAWLLVAPLAAWVVVRLFGLERGFLLVVLVAYTPLAVAGTAIAVVAAAALRQWGAALVAAVLAAVLVVMVAPRALGGPTDPEGAPGPRLRVLTANLRVGRASPEAVVALVRRVDADVLSIQELTPESARALDAAGLDELLPERMVDARPGGRGTGLYARVPLQPGAAVQSRNALVAAAVRLPDAPALEIAAVHPEAPLRSSKLPAWRADLRSLPAASPDGAIRILAGDFNATLDHAELRRVIDTGYEDAAAEVGAGLRATWPSGRRFPPPVTVDHVLADARCGVRQVTVHTLPRTDHRAVFAELVLPRAG